MSRPKPPLLRLHEMTPGQFGDFFALLAERSRAATREGKPYYSCKFRDAHRTASLMVWGDSPWFDQCEKEWREGQFFKMRGTYGEHERYGPQIDVQQARHATEADRNDGFNPGDFIRVSRRDPKEMLTELRVLVEQHIADPPLRRLVLTILEKHAELLQRLPATVKNFYPFPGGLLEHILSVTQSCILLADRYISCYPELKPPINRDLVVAGAILHDIGRVLELKDDLTSVQQTTAGRFMGHVLLGRDLVRDAAREQGDVNPELLQLLEHMILSHLNHPEWGSPRLPLVPEVLILHHLDDLDAKLEMYVRCLTKDTADGAFTERDPVLGKQLFKGRSI